eukprot:GHVQ01028164.1.p1 GENE.GHVQ01028164.1~~GHVQ01028164.1.p1  ORF type:complete len:238 (-),score=28.99 GHVQ01028164.1:432-1145(-)
MSSFSGTDSYQGIACSSKIETDHGTREGNTRERNSLSRKAENNSENVKRRRLNVEENRRAGGKRTKYIKQSNCRHDDTVSGTGAAAVVPTVTLMADAASSVKRPRLRKPNTSMLSALVEGNIRSNERMDSDQLRNAEERLRRIDQSGRKARLMTQHLTGQVPSHERKDSFSVEIKGGKVFKTEKPFICPLRVVHDQRLRRKRGISEPGKSDDHMGDEECGHRFSTCEELAEHMRVQH